MSNLIINDVPVRAARGEILLTVARRNRAHIGFVCDGNGLCTTCECRVLEGAEHLTPVNEIERTWLPLRRRRAGYRLACQTALRGDGPVRVLTRAEEFRRLWDGIFTSGSRAASDRSLRLFYNHLIRLNVDHLSHFPANLLRTISRIGLLRTIQPVRDNDRWFTDIGRVIDNRTGDMFADASIPRPRPQVEATSGPGVIRPATVEAPGEVG